MMKKIVKLNESELRKMIMSEVRKLNEVQLKSTDEVTGGSYETMCGILIGKIEFLLSWKDTCKTMEELQHMIDRTFEDIVE